MSQPKEIGEIRGAKQLQGESRQIDFVTRPPKNLGTQRPPSESLARYRRTYAQALTGRSITASNPRTDNRHTPTDTIPTGTRSQPLASRPTYARVLTEGSTITASNPPTATDNNTPTHTIKTNTRIEASPPTTTIPTEIVSRNRPPRNEGDKPPRNEGDKPHRQEEITAPHNQDTITSPTSPRKIEIAPKSNKQEGQKSTRADFERVQADVRRALIKIKSESEVDSKLEEIREQVHRERLFVEKGFGILFDIPSKKDREEMLEALKKENNPDRYKYFLSQARHLRNNTAYIMKDDNQSYLTEEQGSRLFGEYQQHGLEKVQDYVYKVEEDGLRKMANDITRIARNTRKKENKEFDRS